MCGRDSFVFVYFHKFRSTAPTSKIAVLTASLSLSAMLKARAAMKSSSLQVESCRSSTRRKACPVNQIQTEQEKGKCSTSKPLFVPLGSLLYPCFKTALRYGVVSGCFVDGVSPSPPLRPELAPERGLEGSELAFRTPESARKIHAKSFGP